MIYSNGEFIAEDLTQAVQYGMSFFETIRWENGKCEFLEEHLLRLERSSSMIRKKHFNRKEMEQLIEQLIQKNNWDQSTAAVKLFYSPKEDQLSVSIRKNRYTEEMKRKGMSVCFAKDRRNERDRLTYHKSANYWMNLLNLEEAKRKGYDECIFLNTKEYIAEGSYTNLFFRKDGVFYTPKISDGVLPGILRNAMIQNLKKNNFEIREESLSHDFYKECEGVFLTNSLMGAMKIRQFEEKNYFEGRK